MIYEIAVGDAYGAEFEYADPTPDRPNDLSCYPRHPRVRTACVGKYTDDAQMSIAVAETLLAHPEPTARDFIDGFVRCFKRDPREGYARRFQAFLEEIEDADEFELRIRPDSDKSGAAMRAGPVGLLHSIPEVMRVAALQARVTHDTDGGVRSARAAALAVHYFRRGFGPRTDLARWLSAHLPGPWETPWTGPVGSKGMDSAHAAISAIMAHDSLSDILRGCVDFTGDVDTVAAIALGAASCAEDVVSDLPDALVKGLENGAYGQDFLRDLDQRLERFAVAHGAEPRDWRPQASRRTAG